MKSASTLPANTSVDLEIEAFENASAYVLGFITLSALKWRQRAKKFDAIDTAEVYRQVISTTNQVVLRRQVSSLQLADLTKKIGDECLEMQHKASFGTQKDVRVLVLSFLQSQISIATVKRKLYSQIKSDRKATKAIIQIADSARHELILDTMQLLERCGVLQSLE